MTAPDLAAEAAELREIIAGLRDEAADLADSLSQIARSVRSMNAILDVFAAARDEGYREGRGGEADTYQAAARAQQRRGELQVLPGRSAARKGKSGGAR